MAKWTKARRKAQSERMRKLVAEGKLKPKNGSAHEDRITQGDEIIQANRQHDPSEQQVIFCYAHIHGWLSAYAEGHGLSPDVLTRRVAALIHGGASRPVRRPAR